MTRTAAVSLTCLALLTVGLCVECFSASDRYHDDPYMKVFKFTRGDAVAGLLREVGDPSSEQRIGGHAPGDWLCNHPNADRVLFYDVPSRGLDRRLRDLLGLHAAFSIVVCVDVSGRIQGIGSLTID